MRHRAHGAGVVERHAVARQPPAAIGGENFFARVEEKALAVAPRLFRHDGCQNGQGAVLERARAQGDLHGVVENVVAGADFGDAEAFFGAVLEAPHRGRRAHAEFKGVGVGEAGAVQADGEGEQAVAALGHRPREGVAGRLAGMRAVVALPLVRQKAHDAQAGQGRHRADEFDGALTVPGHAAAPVARVHLDEYGGRQPLGLEKRRRLPGALKRVEAERDAGAPREGRDARQPRPPGNAVGQPHVVEAGVHERLGLTRLGKGEALRAALVLQAREGDRLVRLGVRTQRDGVRGRAGLHPVEVEQQPRALDEQGGRFQLVYEHGRKAFRAR